MEGNLRRAYKNSYLGGKHPDKQKDRDVQSQRRGKSQIPL